jgi:t-SNARE complex subunit (syntaxin)
MGMFDKKTRKKLKFAWGILAVIIVISMVMLFAGAGLILN